MKKRQHKYFRNQRYKNKLEHMVGENRTYWSRVYFITKEADTRFRRENATEIAYYESRGWEYDKPYGGHDYYIYWERPEVEYSIKEYRSTPRRSKQNKYYKKYSNKIIRQEFKQKGLCYNHCQYKKQFDLKWTLD